MLDWYTRAGKAQVVMFDNHIDDPYSYNQMMKDIDKDKLVMTMNLEME